MKTIATLVLAVLVFTLTGCPSGSTAQKAAQASQNAAIIVQGLETAEIAAHQQDLIPQEDHIFIQTEVLALSQLGKTVDSCIRGAGSTAGTVNCISVAVAQVDQMQNEGALRLRSDRAKQEFSIAISGVKAVLVSVQTVVSTSATK
jgi:hypothetical protein